MKYVLPVLIVFLSGYIAHAQTNDSVVPSGFESHNGNSALALFSNLVPDYQQLYRASSINLNGNDQYAITGVSFRLTPGGSSSFSAVIPKVEIRMTTSPLTPERMTSFYSMNKGSDDIIVYYRESVALFARTGQEVNPFDLTFTFDRPFLYDPNKGSLLLFISHDPTGSGTRSLDAQSYPDLAFSPFGAAGSAFPIPGAYGAVTEFNWIVVPEPSVAGLLLIAVPVIFRRKR